MNKFFEVLFLNPYKIIFSFILISIVSLYFSIENLKINTSTDSLIDNELQFKQDQKKLKKHFSILSNNILIRIEGEESNKVKFIYEEISRKLKIQKGVDFFYSPNFDFFLKRISFYYLVMSKKRIS